MITQLWYFSNIPFPFILFQSQYYVFGSLCLLTHALMNQSCLLVNPSLWNPLTLVIQMNTLVIFQSFFPALQLLLDPGLLEEHLNNIPYSLLSQLFGLF